MFTGIVKFVSRVDFDAETWKLRIPYDEFFKDSVLGDSICVNGVCLTLVEKNESGGLFFDISPETGRLTNIQQHHQVWANVEKSMKYGEDIGGHCISGHVHTTARIVDIATDGGAGGCVRIEFELLDGEVVHKDSISLNGVSLTAIVAGISSQSSVFAVSMVPYTYTNTVFKYLQIGDIVNAELNTAKKTHHSHEYFMREAVKESHRGRYAAPPNPWVGAVVVKDNAIVATGFHKFFGDLHAEANALENLQETGCTLYCTLEPCSHVGKQPACAKTIVNSGKISKVVVGILDPDERVNGKGVEYLRTNGVEVEVGVLKDEIDEDLHPYIVYKKNGNRPFVKAKIALSFDGKYAVPFTNTQITSKKLQNEMHEERRRSQCIVVGSGTVVRDDPKLLGGDCPIIVAIDSKGVIPATSTIMRKGTYVFTNCPPDHPHLEVVYLPIPAGDDICSLLMQFLEEHNVMECLIEGGGELQALFHSKKLIDQFIVCRSPKKIGIAGKSWDLDLENFKAAKSEVRGENEVVTVYNRDTQPVITAEESFSSIADAVDAFKSGKLVVVMDSEDRENEGDLIVHADLVTREQIALINRLCTGIICVPISKKIFQESGLGMMVANNTDAHRTAFTVSCDSESCSTGVSAEDRLATVRAISAGSAHLRKPGHMFPLVANELGLSARKGHTEASIDMCKLCGLKETAVISELILENGTMMRFKEAFDVAKKLNIPIIHTDQIYKEGLKMGIYDTTQPPVKLLAECDLTLRKYGKWKLMSFSSLFGSENKVLVYGAGGAGAPIVRIHSECFTGDVLGSEHCDCGPQLQNSLEKIHANGSGCVIFPASHEGRGIGFTEKVKAYALLQGSDGLDTYSANTKLGHKPDCRNYSECKPILEVLGIVDNFQLLTSNPDKINALEGLKFSAVNDVCGMTPKNLDYLTAKAKKHGTFKLPVVVGGSHKRVCIIHASWYSDLIEPFVDKIKLGLENCTVVKVPGCFEIPLQVQKHIKMYDCVVCIGVILKGETYHFECMAKTITSAIMKLQLEYSVPVLDYILPCYTREQAVARLQDPQPVVDTAKFLLI